LEPTWNQNGKRDVDPNKRGARRSTLITGLRQREAIGLTWARLDRSRGVVQLEMTKSGRRREVPLNSKAGSGKLRHPGSTILSQAGSPMLSHPAGGDRTSWC